MATTYYAAFDDNEQPLGLMRMIVDDGAQTADLERLTADGTWVNDPSCIDELHEPEVRQVESDEAQAISELLGASPDSLPADVTDPTGADSTAAPA